MTHLPSLYKTAAVSRLPPAELVATWQASRIGAGGRGKSLDAGYVSWLPREKLAEGINSCCSLLQLPRCDNR